MSAFSTWPTYSVSHEEKCNIGVNDKEHIIAEKVSSKKKAEDIAMKYINDTFDTKPTDNGYLLLSDCIKIKVIQEENVVYIIDGKNFIINTLVFRNFHCDMINGFAKSFKKRIEKKEEQYTFHFFEIFDLIYKTIDEAVEVSIEVENDTNVAKILLCSMIHAFALSFLEKFEEDNGIVDNSAYNIEKDKSYKSVYILELIFQTVDDVLNEAHNMSEVAAI